MITVRQGLNLIKHTLKFGFSAHITIVFECVALQHSKGGFTFGI